jgi:hypothetical protein
MIGASTMPTSFSFPVGHALRIAFRVLFCHNHIILSRDYLAEASVAWYSLTIVICRALIDAPPLVDFFLGVHYSLMSFAGYPAAAVWSIFLSISTTVRRP